VELKEPPMGINQFWIIFSKKYLTLFVVLNLVFAGGVVASLMMPDLSKTMTLTSVGVLLSISLITNILIFKKALRPLRDILMVLAHTNGERTVTNPPNPGASGYKKSGFGAVLQKLYELSSASSDAQDNKDKATSNNQDSFLSDALDTINCGIVIMDKDRKITYTNRATPVNIDTEGNKRLTLLFNDNDKLDDWLDTCSEHEVKAEHLWTRIPDKMPNEEGRRMFDVVASYNKDAQNETVLTLIDRTEAYEVGEEGLDFISFAAHELRGPITVIRGYLDVLEDELTDVLKEDQHELFRRLTVSANRLSGYINNILNTSRFDRRHLRVHLVEDSVASIYDMIKDDMQLRASSQNRVLNVSIPNDLPTIAADKASISEVFSNLIDNAIKYSNDGGVINVSATAKGDFVEVAIEDHGIGMPSGVVSNLFKKFYRSHRSREAVAGTGIGLYISKAIVESHGGGISVRSEDGKGSVFTISIPIYATVAEKLQASNNSNEGMIGEGKGWIKNHSMYRG